MTGGPYFGKYQRKPKEENALRDVSKRTEHRLLREKERERERRGRSVLFERPQQTTEEETLPFQRVTQLKGGIAINKRNGEVSILGKIKCQVYSCCCFSSSNVVDVTLT